MISKKLFLYKPRQEFFIEAWINSISLILDDKFGLWSIKSPKKAIKLKDFVEFNGFRLLKQDGFPYGSEMKLVNILMNIWTSDFENDRKGRKLTYSELDFG